MLFDVTDPRYAGGAKGTAATDTPAFNAAVAAAKQAGGGTVIAPPLLLGYVIVRKNPGVQAGGIDIVPGVKIVGDGTKLIVRDNINVFYGKPRIGVTAIVTSDVAVGDTTLACSSTAGLNAGDTVHVQLGTAGYDSGEPSYWLLAKILSKTDTTVLLDTPVAAGMSVAGTPDTRHRQLTQIPELIEGETVVGFEIISDIPAGGNIESGVTISYGRNVTMRDMVGSDVGAGLVTAQYVDGLEIHNPHVRRCVAQNGQASKGRGFNFAECHNVLIDNATVENFEKQVIVAESNCKSVRVRNLTVVNNFPGRRNTIEPLFGALGKSEILVDGLVVIGNESFLGDASPEDRLRIRDVNFRTKARPLLNTAGDVLRGYVSYMDERYQEVKTFSKVVPLTPGNILLPRGYYRKVHFLVTDKTGVKSIYIDDDRSAVDLMNNLGTVQSGVVNTAWDRVFGRFPRDPGSVANRDAFKRLSIYATATNPGAQLKLEVEYWPDPVTEV